MAHPFSQTCMHMSGPLQRRPPPWRCPRQLDRRQHRQSLRHSTRLHVLNDDKNLRIAFAQTVDEAHFMIPVDPDVHKSDLNLQLHPKRLQLKVKGEQVMSGDFPEDVDPDGCFWTIEDSPEGDKKLIHLTLLKKEMGFDSWPAWPFEEEEVFPEDEPDPDQPSAFMTHFTYMDITVDDEPLGRLIFGLYGNELKRTVENFRALCAGDRGISKTGVPLHYKGSPFHRIIPKFMAQGGDFTKGNGTGGVSVYGGKFDDEGFPFKHVRSGQLSMANSGPDTNGSQFFITFKAAPHLDGKHVVFGDLYSGFHIMKQLEELGSRSGTVSKAVRIADSGELTGRDSPLHPGNRS